MNFAENDSMIIESNIEERGVIVTDEDTKAEDALVGGGLYPYDPTGTDIEIREEAWTVFELIRKLKRGDLIIPDFQRNVVWSPKQQSQFIESIILNFPLPHFYFNQTTEGKLIIVDGLQRTTTLSQFLNDDFELQELNALPVLIGSSFENLEKKHQVQIEDKKLLVYKIMPSVPLTIVYDIFNRINTGGTQLNRQEIRNCIFNGQSTDLLKEIAQQEYFKQAIGKGISPKRMKDQEAILRYLAFKIFDYKQDYKGDMSDFLENAMRKLNLMSSIELNLLQEDFKRVMILTYDFYKGKNFRFPTATTRGTINIAILESVAHFFSSVSDVFLKQHKRKIIKNFKELLDNEDYKNAVRFSTGDRFKVQTRFEKAKEILGKTT